MSNEIPDQCSSCGGFGGDGHECPTVKKQVMNWTKTKPTVDGYYWYRDRSDPTKHEIARIINGCEYVIFTGDDNHFILEWELNNAEWLGPLTPESEGE